MTFHILTIFPEYFRSPIPVGVIGKAIEKGIISVNLVNIRDFGLGKRKMVDDRPFGGGPGMVMMVEPIVKALRSLKLGSNPVKILLSPSGEIFQASTAKELSEYTDIVLICARYEGIDERVAKFVDREISIGDFILPGGEAAALVILECVSRFVKGVLGNEESMGEQIERGLLSYPQYTRPREFESSKVPDVLLSGDHAKIEMWRKEQMIRRTLERRPELIRKSELDEKEKEILKIKEEEKNGLEVAIK